MSCRKIICGYKDGSFKPNNKITRAEFTTLVVNTFNLESSTNKVFSDTENH
ncbi:S-layer homology domain-containing protein [Gottschalkia purinilytica]|uniref:S-layer homology domain-containing protein n=1 Tax=Gottschalkia purinilytica TaxID=1503 RepID=UPI0009E28413